MSIRTLSCGCKFNLWHEVLEGRLEFRNLPLLGSLRFVWPHFYSLQPGVNSSWCSGGRALIDHKLEARDERLDRLASTFPTSYCSRDFPWQP